MAWAQGKLEEVLCFCHFVTRASQRNSGMMPCQVIHIAGEIFVGGVKNIFIGVNCPQLVRY